ncbi:MAG: DUF6531 domain-containing protein, partial [Elusimicrobiota bacterium]
MSKTLTTITKYVLISLSLLTTEFCYAEYSIDAVLSGFGSTTVNTSYQSVVLLGGQEVIGSSVTSTYNLGIGHIYHLPLAATTYYEPPVPGSTPYWASAYGDNTHTSNSSLVSGPHREPILSSAALVASQYATVPPIVDSEGIVYLAFGTLLKMYDNTTGAMTEYYTFADNINAVTVGNSDDLYVITNANRVYKFVGGELAWVSAVYTSNVSPVTIGYSADNAVYITAGDNTVYALSITYGTENWSSGLGGYLTPDSEWLSGSSIGNDTGDRLYINTDISVLSVNTSNGAYVWRTDLSSDCYGPEFTSVYTPAVDENDNLYVSVLVTNNGEPGYTSYVKKLDNSGNILWAHSMANEDVLSIPNVMDSNNVSVLYHEVVNNPEETKEMSGIRALNTSNGTTKWEYYIPNLTDIPAPRYLISDKDNVVYACSDNNVLYAVYGGSRAWSQPVYGDSGFMMALGKSGALFLLNHDSTGSIFSSYAIRSLPSIAQPNGANTGVSLHAEDANGVNIQAPMTSITTPSTNDIEGTENIVYSVNTLTGNLYYPITDIYLPNSRGLPLHFTRTYNSMQRFLGPFGYGWTHPFDTRLRIETDGTLTQYRGDSAEIKFTYDPIEEYYYPPSGTRTKIYINYSSNVYTMREQVGGVHYDYDIQTGLLKSIVDPNNNTVSFEYSDTTGTTLGGNLCRITDVVGRVIQLEYNEKNFIQLIVDPLGQGTSYYYETAGYHLTRVEGPGGYVAWYEYNSPINANLLTRNEDPRVRPKRFAVRTYEYNFAGRCSYQYGDDGESVSISYDDAARENTFTDSRQNTTKFLFDSSGRITQITNASPLVLTKHYDWDSGNNNTKVTGYGGNVYTYEYDTNGNVSSMTTPAGTTLYTYDSTFNKIESFTNEREYTHTYHYDTKGNLDLITDPYDKTVQNFYDSYGQLSWTKNARNKYTYYYYDAYGNRYKTVDAENKTSYTYYDTLGRSTYTVNARGYATVNTLD